MFIFIYLSYEAGCVNGFTINKLKFLILKSATRKVFTVLGLQQIGLLLL